MRPELGGRAQRRDDDEDDELAGGDVEYAPRLDVAEGVRGQQMREELAVGLGQGCEDLLDLLAVQGRLDGGAGGLAVLVGDRARGLERRLDARGGQGLAQRTDGVEGLGPADVRSALVDRLAQLERSEAGVQGRAQVRSELRQRLHGGQDGDGEHLAFGIGEPGRGEDLAEDLILEDFEQLGVGGVGRRLRAEQPGEGPPRLGCQCHGSSLPALRSPLSVLWAPRPVAGR